MKKSKINKDLLPNWFISFMGISTFLPLLLGTIIVFINKNIGLNIMLLSLFMLYIDSCIIILYLLLKKSIIKFLIILVITLMLISVGIIFKYRGLNEQVAIGMVAHVDSSFVTVEYEDIQMHINKPFWMKVRSLEHINIYYDNENIDSMRLLSYSKIGNNSLGYGIVFPFVGGIFMSFIPEMINDIIEGRKEKKNEKK